MYFRSPFRGRVERPLLNLKRISGEYIKL